MAAKKAPKKPVKAKKVVVRKVAPKKSTRESAIKKQLSKTEMFTTIAQNTELSRKQITQVFDELSTMMARHLKDGGAGMFTLPGLLKCEVKKKPATKARKGINPFTGQEMMFKAKPARKVIKVKPLKKLKEMVA